MTATTLTVKPKIAQTVFFWLSVIFLGFMLWKLLTMPSKGAVRVQSDYMRGE